jgi:hypothetical protein
MPIRPPSPSLAASSDPANANHLRVSAARDCLLIGGDTPASSPLFVCHPESAAADEGSASVFQAVIRSNNTNKEIEQWTRVAAPPSFTYRSENGHLSISPTLSVKITGRGRIVACSSVNIQ